MHHCATNVRLYVWPYRICLVAQTTKHVLGSSFLAKRSACSLVYLYCVAAIRLVSVILNVFPRSYSTEISHSGMKK